MILVDLNQVMFSTFQISAFDLRKELTVDMVRHIVLNVLRSYNVKWKPNFGEMVLASDSSSYWRRKVFPFYKAQRKAARESSPIDWNLIFKAMNQIKKEIIEYLPYKLIEIENAEADDIIGTICINNPHKKILILSADKDFIQLHTNNISQYDPIHKKSITHPNPKEYLKDHIIKGDIGDGIPNMFSPDDTFVVGKRQIPVTKKRISQYFFTDQIDNKISEDWKRNFHRNKELIDLSCIPKELTIKIIEEFNKENNKDRKPLFDYLIKNRLSVLTEKINDF